MARQPTYMQARLLLLALGTALAAGQTLIAWERGAPPTEVLAPALYVPVFAGAVIWRIPGGLVAAALSSLIYGVLLAEQTAAIGMRLFMGLLVTRSATYVFYGVIIAVAARYLESRLRKLELHDRIDDLTGLYNSAFMLETIDLEVERAKRYRTLFSVVDLQIGREAFRGMSRRAYRRVVRDLGRRIDDGPRRRWDDPWYRRQTDLVARIDDGERDRLLYVLPETPPQGAETFANKVERGCHELLAEHGCDADGHVSVRTLTFPQDPRLGELTRQFSTPGQQGAQAREEFNRRMSSEPLSVLRDEVAAVEARRTVIRDTPPVASP